MLDNAYAEKRAFKTESRKIIRSLEEQRAIRCAKASPHGTDVPTSTHGPAGGCLVKVHPFDMADVATWFNTAVAIMLTKGNLSHCKMLASILPSLGDERLAVIRAITVQSPLSENCFDKAREILIAHHRLPRMRRFDAAMSLQRGDLLPSVFLSKLRQILEPSKDPAFLAYLIERSLPEIVRTTVSAAKAVTAEELVKMADDLCVNTLQSKPTFGISSLSKSETEAAVNAAQLHLKFKPEQRNKSGMCSIHKRWGKSACACYGDCSMYDPKLPRTQPRAKNAAGRQ